LTIITPSNWLENYVKQSFFQQFNIVTINNYVDLKLFKRQSSTALRLKYNIPNGKRVLLGVSNIWNIQKGLNEFINISKEISDDMIIILIGLTNKQKDKLKKYKNIFGIEKVNNSYEMAGFYSMADVLINPSKEETFSLVTLESIACNTPVIVYNNTPMVEFVNNNSGLICNKKISINDIRKSFGIDIENSYIKKYNIKNFQRKIIKLYGGK
jgi:glycosyltransferase involved in cell wall biosynthesis